MAGGAVAGNVACTQRVEVFFDPGEPGYVGNKPLLDGWVDLFVATDRRGSMSVVDVDGQVNGMDLRQPWPERMALLTLTDHDIRWLLGVA